MAEYKKRSTKDQGGFLSAYAVVGSLAGAFRVCGISTTAHNSWFQHDPDYPEKFAEAQRQSAVRLEEVARIRAIEGVKEYQFYKGQPIMHPITGEPYYVQKFMRMNFLELLGNNERLNLSERKWPNLSERHSSDFKER